MTRIVFSCLPLLLIGALAVRADQLDFNALQLGEEVQGYYNGGLGSMGTGRGPNLAISFTSDFATIADGVFGPPLRAEKLTTGSGTMDIAAAFSGFFSFYYKNSGPSGTVNLYSGLDGGGALVGTIPLPAASIFSPAGLFEGTPFKSAVFTGNADALVFDNITLGGGLVIPEPGSALSDGQRDGWDGTDPEDIHESICQAFNFWVAAPSDGGFIEATDPRFGLNSLTTDTSTGLQWLDLNVSAGRSFTDVASQFGPSGDFAGYRYATPVEIGNLFNSFGLLREIDPGTNTSTFFSLFGSTSSQAGNPEVFGWASDALTAQYNIYGLDFSFSSGGPKYNVLLGDSLNENPTLVFPSTGSWLVAVPEPAPFALLALGLAGLVIRGRKPTRLRC